MTGPTHPRDARPTRPTRSTGVTAGRDPAVENGPGILETSIVLGGSVLLALAIIFLLGGQLADVIGLLVDAAHGGR